MWMTSLPKELKKGNDIINGWDVIRQWHEECSKHLSSIEVKRYIGRDYNGQPLYDYKNLLMVNIGLLVRNNDTSELSLIPFYIPYYFLGIWQFSRNIEPPNIFSYKMPSFTKQFGCVPEDQNEIHVNIDEIKRKIEELGNDSVEMGEEFSGIKREITDKKKAIDGLCKEKETLAGSNKHQNKGKEDKKERDKELFESFMRLDEGINRILEELKPMYEQSYKLEQQGEKISKEKQILEKELEEQEMKLKQIEDPCFHKGYVVDNIKPIKYFYGTALEKIHDSTSLLAHHKLRVLEQLNFDFSTLTTDSDWTHIGVSPILRKLFEFRYCEIPRNESYGKFFQDYLKTFQELGEMMCKGEPFTDTQKTIGNLFDSEQGPFIYLTQSGIESELLESNQKALEQLKNTTLEGVILNAASQNPTCLYCSFFYRLQAYTQEIITNLFSILEHYGIKKGENPIFRVFVSSIYVNNLTGPDCDGKKLPETDTVDITDNDIIMYKYAFDRLGGTQ